MSAAPKGRGLGRKPPKPNQYTRFDAPGPPLHGTSGPATQPGGSGRRANAFPVPNGNQTRPRDRAFGPGNLSPGPSPRAGGGGPPGGGGGAGGPRSTGG